MEKLATDEELEKMSLSELEAYRAYVEGVRVKFREHTRKVGDRFRDVSAAIAQAQRLGADEQGLRVVPGVALARAIRTATTRQLAPAMAKGGAIMQDAFAPADPADKPEPGNS